VNTQRPAAGLCRSSVLRLKHGGIACTVKPMLGFGTKLLFARDNSVELWTSFDSHTPFSVPFVTTGFVLAKAPSLIMMVYRIRT